MDSRIAAVFDLLRDAQGRRPVFVWVAWSDGSLELHTLPGQGVAAGALAPAPCPAQPPGPARAGSLRQGIVDVLRAEGPLKAAGICRRLDRSNSGHFREVLLELVEEGVVVLCPGNTYGLPGASSPTAGH